MAISIQCPQCGKSYNHSDDLAGKRVKCKCGQAFAAPARRSSKGSGMSPLVLTAIIGGGAVVVLFIGLMIFLMSGPKDRTEALSGFTTPEEAFEALQKATVDRDWAAQLAVFAPESRERIVGSVVYWPRKFSQASESSREIVETLKKHGIDESVSVERPSAMLTANMEKELRELAAIIKDKSALYVELAPVALRADVEMASKLRGITREKAEQLQEQRLKAHAEAKLMDVQISDDTAEGKQQIFLQGRTLDAPVHFRRIDQRWYIRLPDAREAMEVDRRIGQAIAERTAQGGGPANAP